MALRSLCSFSSHLSVDRNGNSLQCSCLGNPMDRGAWRATVHVVEKESDMTERLNTHRTHTICRSWIRTQRGKVGSLRWTNLLGKEEGLALKLPELTLFFDCLIMVITMMVMWSCPVINTNRNITCQLTAQITFAVISTSCMSRMSREKYLVKGSNLEV